MKRPLAYITAAWTGDQNADAEQAARYCRAVMRPDFPGLPPALPAFISEQRYS